MDAPTDMVERGYPGDPEDVLGPDRTGTSSSPSEVAWTARPVVDRSPAGAHLVGAGLRADELRPGPGTGDVMEDRQPPRLHLELVRQPDGVDERAAAVEAAGWMVSVWEPATSWDDDLPRRLPRCDGVVIGEGDGGVVEPPSPASTVVPLVRYPRPSQGSCSGERTTGILLVLISAKERQFAQELRDWGDFVHLRHIAEAAVPGYRTITPWENESSGTPRFCHLYEMVGDDPQGTFEQMTPLVRRRLDPATFEDWAWHPQLLIEESRAYRRRDPA